MCVPGVCAGCSCALAADGLTPVARPGVLGGMEAARLGAPQGDFATRYAQTIYAPHCWVNIGA